MKKCIKGVTSSFVYCINLFQSSPSSAIFVPLCFRVTLWHFSSSANYYFKVSQHFNADLGHWWNDSKYRDVAPLTNRLWLENSIEKNSCDKWVGGSWDRRGFLDFGLFILYLTLTLINASFDFEKWEMVLNFKLSF